ncbi:MAG: DUF11 domain-containing protein [Candidatus Eremiobacteraeota bacterium]|nr:DUF11 domain-containing protein [Candidatus Eremiobacteraeota bacterium]
MRTLTEVFAPGAPTLPEGLRTLAVSPDRELEPGMTVRASFTFRNQGGATATGVRVRFNLPDGLMYLVGTGLLDDTALDDEQGNSPIVSRSGAHIGDVAPGQERRIDIAYNVAGAIENGTTVELQAAVAAFELPPVGSNVVRLIARSKPALENVFTTASIEATHDPQPGAEATVTVRVHNAGESSAHDVIVVSPVPEHTVYVANSARVNGRELERELGGAFDRIHAPVVMKNLPASATATLVYRVRIDEPLADGTAIVASAEIASQETTPFRLQPVSIRVRARPDFSDDRTACTIDPAFDVVPGTRVGVRLRATNIGSTSADSVSAAVTFGEGLLPVKGASRLDGRPTRDRKKDPLQWDLGRIEASGSVDLSTEAVVISPLANGTQISVVATLSWEDAQADGGRGQRTFERVVAVRSEPHLPQRHNAIRRTSRALVRPAEEIEAVVTVANEGSAPATDAVLQLHPDRALDDVRVSEKNAKLSLDGDSVELGTIGPYANRRIVVRARVRSPYPDRSEVRLGASVHTHELGETDLGEAEWQVDSHPAFASESSALSLVNDDVLRPNQLADVYVRLRNCGTDSAQGVRLRLYVSPEARLESVDGATRERSTLLFGEIAPGAGVEARLGLRLMRSLAKEYPVTIDAVLSADAMLPMQLNRLTIVTTAEPNFSVGTFRSEPADTIDVGEMVEYVLHVRNGGDGPARRMQITVDGTGALIYVPNSTTVNDVPVRDDGSNAPFAAVRGIALNDVDPGVEAAIKWRDVVHNGLPAGEAIVRAAHIRYDGDRSDDIVSPDLKVRATPAFANNIPGLPFGLDGMIGPSFAGGPRALEAAEGLLQLPPAQPVGHDTYRLEDMERYIPLDADAREPGLMSREKTPGAATTSLAFSQERLDRTMRFLEEARFGGLVTHLFALRALLPESIGDLDATAVSPVRESMRDVLDRLFIKLRLPNYAIAARDVETPSMRAAIERFLHDVADARGNAPEPVGAVVVLRGQVDSRDIENAVAMVHDAALCTAAPWAALAKCVGDSRADVGNYRMVLCATLDELATLDAGPFVEALQRRPYPVLDAALDVVRAGLSAARA